MIYLPLMPTRTGVIDVSAEMVRPTAGLRRPHETPAPGALVDVLPGAALAVVIAPVVARSEGCSGLDLVLRPVVLRAFHRAVARDSVPRHV